MKLSAFTSLTFAASAPPITGWLVRDNTAQLWALALYILWAWGFFFAALWFYRCVQTHVSNQSN